MTNADKLNPTKTALVDTIQPGTLLDLAGDRFADPDGTSKEFKISLARVTEVTVAQEDVYGIFLETETNDIYVEFFAGHEVKVALHR